MFCAWRRGCQWLLDGGAPDWPTSRQVSPTEDEYRALLSNIDETGKQVVRLLDELESQGVPITARDDCRAVTRICHPATAQSAASSGRIVKTW